MFLTGNDVVDLTEAMPTKKSQDLRFLERVFTYDEQKIILSAKEPELMLWILWSAKESAYKIVSKIEILTPFAYKKFQVNFKKAYQHRDTTYGNFKTELQVHYDKHPIGNLIDLECYGDKNRLHTKASYYHYLDSSLGQKNLKKTLWNKNIISNCQSISETERIDWSNKDFLAKYFTSTEQHSIKHPLGAIVRYDLKKKVAGLLHINSAELQIIRPFAKNKKTEPPYLLIRNERRDIDISLSHHGRWFGWSLNLNENNKNKL